MHNGLPIEMLGSRIWVRVIRECLLSLFFILGVEDCFVFYFPQSYA